MAMSVRDERMRQARLAREIAFGRPTSIQHEYPQTDPPPSLRQYRVKSHEDDYLVCHTWDGETEGEKDVYIAKAWLLRRSVFDFSMNGGRTRENRNGDRIKYTYDDADVHWEREAEIVVEGEEGATEAQIIVPAYVTEERSDTIIGPDVIVAEPLSDPVIMTIDDEEVKTFLVHRDGREWARKCDEE